MKLRIVTLTAVAWLSGCAASSYCLGEQEYQRAPSVPEFKPVAGLKVPQSEGALRIPPAPANTVPYGEIRTDEDGDEVVQCLDKPPELPPVSPEAPATPTDGKPAA